jgi:hypothetical protein
MKKLLLPAFALAAWFGTALTTHAWSQFLDGSSLPEAPWQFYQDGGMAGGTSVVDFLDPATGLTNQALRINSGMNSAEWYLGPLFADQVVAAARFKTVAFSGTASENLLCAEVGSATDHSAAPAITIVTNRYKLWSYTEGVFGSGTGGSQILDLGPVVLEQLHTAYIYAHKSGATRLWWDGALVFDGVAPAVDGVEGYMEWGSGAWQYKATTTIDFDWVGFGGAADVPPQSLFISLQANELVLSWSTNNAGFILQSATKLPSTNWLNVTNEPTLADDRFTVTLPISGEVKFFRLRN